MFIPTNKRICFNLKATSRVFPVFCCALDASGERTVDAAVPVPEFGCWKGPSHTLPSDLQRHAAVSWSATRWSERRRRRPPPPHRDRRERRRLGLNRGSTEEGFDCLAVVPFSKVCSVSASLTSDPSQQRGINLQTYVEYHNFMNGLCPASAFIQISLSQKQQHAWCQNDVLERRHKKSLFIGQISQRAA